MDDETLLKEFTPLFENDSSKDLFELKEKPLLAHYTSVKNLENILRTDELWFSNPLFMNDLEEIRFGILNGMDLASDNEALKSACGTERRYIILKNELQQYFENFEKNHLIDTYVFCLSEHLNFDNDGLLSMWRAYGSNGNGAAIVFDAGLINTTEGSPLLIIKVDYQSSENRIESIKKILSEFAKILKSLELEDFKLNSTAYYLFEKIKIFALSTKHKGFLEEQEWRVVYIRSMDPNKKLDHMFSYTITDTGIEPKLKFEMKAANGITSDDFSLEKIIHSIILGPSLSSDLGKNSVFRMLDSLDKSYLKAKTHASTIPLRPK